MKCYCKKCGDITRKILIDIFTNIINESSNNKVKQIKDISFIDEKGEELILYNKLGRRIQFKDYEVLK